MGRGPPRHCQGGMASGRAVSSRGLCRHQFADGARVDHPLLQSARHGRGLHDGITTKLAQKRHDRCAFARLKLSKTQEPLGKHRGGPLKINALVVNAAFRVDDARQNAQTHLNTKLLGKCRVKEPLTICPGT